MNYFENTNVHPNSIKLYNTKLNEWISYMPTIYQSLACIVAFPELSMQELHSHLKVNTNTNRHIFIVAILSFLKHKRLLLSHLTHEQYSVLRTKWIDINSENEKPIIDRRLENKPTDIQLKKGGVHITFNQIIARRDELERGSFERLLLSMYTMIPPVRADYFSTEIIYDSQPTHKNYIRIHGSHGEVVLTDFKTAKTYKQITHVFPPELLSEILLSLQKYPRSFLFLNASQKPHTRNSFVLWSRRCLTRIFGTDFTLVFFRHAFVTNYISTHDMNTVTDAQIKDISDKLGHSPEMFRAYKWIKQGAKGELSFDEEKDE
jgi:hypothetical protein